MSSSFTPYQIKASDFTNVPVTLMVIKKYGDDTVIIDPIEKTGNAPILPSQVTSIKYKNLPTQTNYTEEKHVEYLSNNNEKIKDHYEELKNSCLELETSLKIVPLKKYIAFKTERNKNVFTVVFNKDSFVTYFFASEDICLKWKHIQIEPADLGHWGTGDKKITINKKTNIKPIVAFFEELVNENCFTQN